MKDIDFNLIKNVKAKKLMRRILCKDPSNRIKMEDILEDAWVTNDGKERLDPNEVQYFKKGDLGNVDRLMKMNQMGLSTTNINHKKLGINLDSIKKNEAIIGELL